MYIGFGQAGGSDVTATIAAVGKAIVGGSQSPPIVHTRPLASRKRVDVQVATEGTTTPQPKRKMRKVIVGGIVILVIGVVLGAAIKGK